MKTMPYTFITAPPGAHWIRSFTRTSSPGGRCYIQIWFDIAKAMGGHIFLMPAHAIVITQVVSQETIAQVFDERPNKAFYQNNRLVDFAGNPKKTRTDPLYVPKVVQWPLPMPPVPPAPRAAAEVPRGLQQRKSRATVSRRRCRKAVNS